ncbi:fibrinogen-like protein 1 [Gigantopelta aegis]|uniref:fibrinogen-like protein 1 n=1 Tax=Gigantopelta aegis TaxID=1735272 RepID=UPI001B888755|nr:fibrinogen-like protein 1 [Gigantopelta aegis]
MYTKETFPEIQSDCYDVMMNGGDASGIYTIQPRDSDSPINVSCEMAPDDGGWLVIQRRTDGSEDFYRTWDEYRDGFGDLKTEFWLGNKNIYRISDQSSYDLRIDLEDFEGNSRYAVYKEFSLEREVNDFRLSIGQYSGTAGDRLSSHYGQPFSTWDRDLDSARLNCAQ